MTYTPRWRLASWYPDSYSVEVEGEPGRVEIDDDDFGFMSSGDINESLWTDACDDLRDAGIVPPPDADDDWRYPPDAYQRLPWRGWSSAHWHIQAAILARRVEVLEIAVGATRAVLRAHEKMGDEALARGTDEETRGQGQGRVAAAGRRRRGGGVG